MHKKNSNKVKEKGIQLKKEKESERNKEAYVEKSNIRVKLKNLLFYKVLIWFRLPKEKVN